MQVALTIAGSDSGGGAGIQADLKTFHQFGVFGTSAIAAITAQNTVGVIRWEAVEPALVRAQIDAVATDLRPAAVKSGMLPTEEVVTVVARAITDHRLAAYVLDPVMVATSGDLLVHADAVDAIRANLLPLAALATPNADEAAVLAGFPVRTEADMHRAAEAILALGARAVLVKGGHLDETGSTVVDLLYDGSVTRYSHPRIEGRTMHGTGCTLSAAIAAQLAKGASMQDAVRSATDYVHEAIRTAPSLGAGSGPLNHFAPVNLETNSRTSA